MGRPATPLSIRFWAKVDKTSECWLWTAGVDKDGYGRIWVNAERRAVHANIIAWELTNGPVPDGLCVCHRCDNPRCVKPTHLFLGTIADNTEDARIKGRLATSDRNGMRVHPESTLRGEANPNSKLRTCDVKEIFRLYNTGKVRQVDLAKQFGVTQTAISGILLGRGWKHVYVTL